LRVGCEFTYDVSAPTPVTVQVRPRSDSSHQLVTESWSTTPSLPVDEYSDFYGNPVKRFVMPTGSLALRYDAVCAVPDEPDPDASAVAQSAVEDMPGDLLHFTLPSRYCLSDELSGMAWELFGQTQPGGSRVQAICDWVHENIRFKYGTSNPLTTAADVLRDRIGVCRDLTHLAVTFCRAMNIPARYCTGYLGDIGVPPVDDPMDFSAWFEVFLGGQWHTFDARHNTQRIGRVLIARGRDAADVALSNTFGPATLTSFRVWTDEVPTG